MALAPVLARSRIFYGWYIVGLAILAQFMAIGIQTYSFGVFLKPVSQELGWSRADFSAVQTLSTIVTGLVGFAIGGLIDRHGGRGLMIFGALVTGASLMALSRVQELWQFYIIRSLIFSLGAVCMGNLVVNVAVSNWFVKKRGMALTYSAIGISLGGVVMVPLATALIDTYGWRTSWILLGIMMWALVIIPAFLIMRRRPEDVGLLPDGGPALAMVTTGRQEPSRPALVSEDNWTRSEAVRTGTLWLITFAYGIANVGLGAVLLHLVPFLTDNGFSRSLAASMISVQALSSLLSKPLVWAYLMDHFHARYLSAAAFTVAALAMMGLLYAAQAGSAPLVYLFLIIWGLGIGGTLPLQETVWASYFGRLHLGSVRSVAMPFSILFSAGGPLLAGYLYDSTGDYQVAFSLFASLWVAGALLVLLARPPRHQMRESRPAPAGS